MTCWRSCATCAWAPARSVLQQGDADDDLFLVLSGRLQVRIEFGSGVAATVEEVGPGGVVGEMALLTGQRALGDGHGARARGFRAARARGLRAPRGEASEGAAPSFCSGSCRAFAGRS